MVQYAGDLQMSTFTFISHLYCVACVSTGFLRHSWICIVGCKRIHTKLVPQKLNHAILISSLQLGYQIIETCGLSKDTTSIAALHYYCAATICAPLA